MRSLRTAAACIAIAVQAATALAYPAGVVLCVADDGHVAVETAHETARCTADFERHHPETAAAGADPHAHPCTDTFISQPMLRNPSLVSTLGAAAPPAPTWGLRASVRPDPARMAARGSIAPHALCARRSVVLVI